MFVDIAEKKWENCVRGFMKKLLGIVVLGLLLISNTVEAKSKNIGNGLTINIPKKYMGIVRTTFLINSKGKIHKIWSNVRVKDHAKEVLEELKNI